MKPNLPLERPSKRSKRKQNFYFIYETNYFSKPSRFKVCSVNEAYCWFVVGKNSTSSHCYEHSQQIVCAYNNFLHNSFQIRLRNVQTNYNLSLNMCSMVVFKTESKLRDESCVNKEEKNWNLRQFRLHRDEKNKNVHFNDHRCSVICKFTCKVHVRSLLTYEKRKDVPQL